VDGDLRARRDEQADGSDRQGQRQRARGQSPSVRVLERASAGAVDGEAGHAEWQGPGAEPGPRRETGGLGGDRGRGRGRGGGGEGGGKGTGGPGAGVKGAPAENARRPSPAARRWRGSPRRTGSRSARSSTSRHW